MKQKFSLLEVICLPESGEMTIFSLLYFIQKPQSREKN